MRQRGFTLIEILVVVAIMAIVLGATVARLELSDSRKARHAAEQLGDLFDSARDEAVTSGRNVAISSDGEGYQFWIAEEGRSEWLPLADNELLRAGRLASGVNWSAQAVNGNWRPVGERIVFTPNGLVEPFQVKLTAGESSVIIATDVMGRMALDAEQK
jgi:general secretion pathway protein H